VEHERGIDKQEARRLAELIQHQFQQLAHQDLPASGSLLQAALFLESLAEDLRERATSVGLPYPPDES
jgi:hypothetical protein